MCSVALFGQVSGHLLDELEAVLHVLELAIAVLAFLLPESNDDNGSSLADASTTTTSGELAEGCLIFLVGEHELLATHADTSSAGLSVSISGTKGAVDLVDLDVLNGTIHLLERVLVGGQVVTFGTSAGPEGTIVTVECSTVANTGDGVIVGLVVEPVQYLIGICLPSVLCHCFFYLKGEIFNCKLKFMASIYWIKHHIVESHTAKDLS